MTQIEKNVVRDLTRIAEAYANIYEPRYRTMAKNAFLDGMTFTALVKDENITAEQVTEELCHRIRKSTEQIIKEAHNG